MNEITMQLVADKYIKMALEEDINSEDISTNAVMPEYKKGEVTLLAKQDGIIAGLQVFKRVFTMLDPNTEVILPKRWKSDQGWRCRDKRTGACNCGR